VQIKQEECEQKMKFNLAGTASSIRQLLSKDSSISADPDYWHLTFLDSFLKVLKPQISIEIGIAEGQGTRVLSRHSKSVFAVDSDANSLSFVKNLKNVTWVNSYSWEALEQFSGNLESKVDFCFIDGDHRSEIAFGDFERAQKLMGEGGVIALHDTYPKSIDFTSEANEWCGSAYRVPEMIRMTYPEFECITIARHPGLTLVQKAVSKPFWM
jgi:predicted O-methyltransferase YrrM